MGSNAIYWLLREIRSAPEKIWSTCAYFWGRTISMFKKFCKILNHLKVVSFQEGIIEKGSPRTAPATSCSRLKRQVCKLINV